MVISLPTSKTTSVAVGVGIVVVIGEAVCAKVLGCWVEIGSLIAGKSATLGLAVIVGGITVTASPEAGPADGGVTITPSPASLQPTTNARKIKNTRIKCFRATKPI